MASLIDETKRKKYAWRALVTTLICLHVWATVLIFCVAGAKKTEMDGETIRLMFSSIQTAILINLLLLISDKAIDFVLARFGAGGAGNSMQPVQITETVQKTIVPAQSAPPVVPAAENVNIKAENVNVEQPKS